MIYKINDEWYDVDIKKIKYYCEYDHGNNEVFATYSFHKSRKDWVSCIGTSWFDDCKHFSCEEHRDDLWLDARDTRWKIIDTSTF